MIGYFQRTLTNSLPSLYLLYHLDGRTVVGEFLKLEIKIIQPGDKLRLRRVTSDDDELLGEDSFDDKTAPVMLLPGFAKQLLEANILLFIKAKKNTCNSEFWAAVFFFG